MMATYITADCDRCGVQIVRTACSGFLEFRHGKGRLRRQVDLCTACKSAFDDWLSIHPSGEMIDGPEDRDDDYPRRSGYELGEVK